MTERMLNVIDRANANSRSTRTLIAIVVAVMAIGNIGAGADFQAPSMASYIVELKTMVLGLPKILQTFCPDK